jgi:hypothetical protein
LGQDDGRFIAEGPRCRKSRNLCVCDCRELVGRSPAPQDADPSNDSSSVTITTSDPPPVISNISVSKSQLWPPNHKMVDVTVSYTLTDNCPLSEITRS